MKKNQDERIIAGKRKINSTAFQIIFIGLWAILWYRQFVLEQDVSEYGDILILVIGISLYISLSNVMNGFFLTYRKKREKKWSMVTVALIGSAVAFVIQLLFTEDPFTKGNLLSILVNTTIFFAVWMIIQFPMIRYSEKLSNKDLD
ncbi:MAG: hypothetical protein H0Z32_08010 [Bacillaceae bacterium]|nr:hypothetical protein [Bacillaceae bacterium]